MEVPNHGVLSDVDIKRELEYGNIIITPFNENQLSNCSYDVTIGEYYYKGSGNPEYINPWNSSHIARYWGDSKNAIVYDESMADLYKDETLKKGDKIIVLGPGETILAHTNEFIGGKNKITTMMKTRSSLGRSGICACKAAGWGDIGFINRYTMEITNFSSSHIILPVGKRVAQIVFLYTGITNRPYRSKYQYTDDINELREKWMPSMMLPRLELD